MMNRRVCLRMVSALPLALTLPALAQFTEKNHRVGLLIAETLAGQSKRLDALRAGLGDFGYIEKKNISFEIRTADSEYDRLPALAAELVQLKPAVIVAFGAKAVTAAQRATSTIPIVVPVTGDPIGLGLTKSLAHPSGNITGSTTIGSAISGKRVELLKEISPGLRRVAALINPANNGSSVILEAMQAAAQQLKLELQPFAARRQSEIASAFEQMIKAKCNAVAVQQDTLFIAHAEQIAKLAINHRLPGVGTREYAEAGGLIGYGANDAALYRRGAYFIDRILKGARPADLPFEQATRIELVVNLKAARAIKVNVPQALLVRADEVIE